jgi:membrane-associated phospholipid phosphatase
MPAQAQPEAADEADTAESFVWPARTFAWYDYAYTGVLVGGAALEIAMPVGTQEGERRHPGGILFDDALHDEIVLGSERERHTVATAADVMLGTLIAYPSIVPAAVVWGGRGSGSAALQLTMINLQSFAFTSVVTGVTKRIADRERPIATKCVTDPDYDSNCATADKHYSFPSGHASLAFTGAALTCLHHFQLDLIGGGGDAVACATGVALAAFTGVSRMASDKHYASDVIGGALIGSVSGSLMPWLLYYIYGADTAVTETSFVTPRVTSDDVGLSWTGVF